MNDFWAVWKKLEGRWVATVDEHPDGGVRVTCTDGYVVRIDVDVESATLITYNYDSQV